MVSDFNPVLKLYMYTIVHAINEFQISYLWGFCATWVIDWNLIVVKTS